MSENKANYNLSKRNKTYVDVSLSFVPSAITGDVTVLTNERAINNSIKNIIMFLPGEVAFDYDVGSTTTRYLFDTMDQATAGLLQTEIIRAIEFCEPRVTFTPLNPATTIPSEIRNAESSTTEQLWFQDDLGVFVNAQPDSNTFEVTVKYRIVGDERVYRVQTILTPTR